MTRDRRNSAPSRRGSAYVLVLGAAMIVAMIGVGGAIASRTARRAAQLDSDGAALNHAALGALRAAAGNAQNTIAWRAAAKAAAPLSLTVDGIAVSAVGSDPDDADLSNDLFDRVTLVATASKGQARRIVSMTLGPDDTLSDALGSAVHSNGDITVSGGAVLMATGRVSTNGSITGGTIRADAAAVGAIAGTISGTQTTLASAFTMPSGLEARYEAIGTAIPLSAFASRRIEKNVLGPAKNPFGSTNALGVYVIDCAGQAFEVRDARLNCTLVLKDCSKLTLSSGVLWTAPRSDWPLVICSGPIHSDMVAANLSEVTANTNFNPTNMAYDGVTDTDKSDSYPSMLRGIVYSASDFSINSGALTLEGAAILAGEVKVSGTGSLRVRFKCDSAPPGFGEREYTADLSSLARVVE
ncbi:MAG: hypothetical protein IT434_15765 [Phycisphaerales bacterium]|jgi:Tfp pilus assembly protein PilX|nr:hypothetical protein [Phycisphaerales bacterium]